MHWSLELDPARKPVKMNSSRLLARINGLLTAATLAVMFGGAAAPDNAKAQMICPAAGCGPVMVNPIKAYLIYWLPIGFRMDPNGLFGSPTGPGWDVESLTLRFINDISATPYFNIVTQYPGTCGSSACVVQNIPGAVALGGFWEDSQAFPHAGTQTDPLQDGDIRNEVQRAVTQNHWSVDANSVFFVFTGARTDTASPVEECKANNVSCTFKGAPSGFCGYHDFFQDANGTLYLYAFMSDAHYNVTAGCNEGINYSPNGNLASDREVVLMTHEFFETVTDPLANAWGSVGLGGIFGGPAEIGDICNQQGVDVHLHGNPYAVQRQWSNNSGQCEPVPPLVGTCPVDETDCSGILTITCNGQNVGIYFNGNCHDLFGYPAPCTAGFTGASTVSAGGNVKWMGSTTSPNVATVCTESALRETCSNFSAPVPACPIIYYPPSPSCPDNEKWCFRFEPPRCAPFNDCRPPGLKYLPP